MRVEKGSRLDLTENTVQLPEDTPILELADGEEGMGEGSQGRPPWKLAAAAGHCLIYLQKGLLLFMKLCIPAILAHSSQFFICKMRINDCHILHRAMKNKRYNKVLGAL